ncbi:calcium-binding protein [Shimia sp.]|uniref:calcium-binding protein n=1 Tax=Shimia sp. TaxID=1954381 RepID=UPI003567174B
MLILASLLSIGVMAWAFDAIYTDGDEAGAEADTIEIDQGDNDLVMGTEGDDAVDTGAGEDVVFGDEGNDTIYGGTEGDLLLGGSDDDLLQGAQGDDVLVGGDGVDTLIGNSGNDYIDGSSTMDVDALVASLATAQTSADLDFVFDVSSLDTDDGDVIEGRGGNDALIMGSADSVSGGDGLDEFAAGQWIRPGEPAIVEDYTAGDDIITYTFEGATPPTLTTSLDGATGDVTVFADGQEVIVVLGAGAAFDENDILLLQYA